MIYRPNQYVSTGQAAKEKGVDVATIRRACVDGEIPAELAGGRYIMLWRDVEPWQPGKAGRPKKTARNADK